MITKSQLLTPHRTTQKSDHMSASTVQNLLELCQLGALITVMGKLLQYLTLSWYPKGPSPDTAPCHSLKFCCWHQRAASCEEPSAAMRPPLSLLCSGLNKPRALSHSYIFPFRPFAIFVASLWMFSNSFVFTLWCPDLHAVLMVRLHKCRVES